MPPIPVIEHDVSLQPFNTFGLPARARRYLRVTDPAQLDSLRAATQHEALAGLPRFVLGGGSNVLLVRDIEALVLHMAIPGREVIGEENGAVLVRAGAGENWHGFVEFTLAQGLGGLENLSLIPGTVGAAPIQNIGAYGLEIKDVFHSLTAYDLATGERRTLHAADCRFGYRDSLFKQADGAGLVVLDVTFALPRAWQPNLRYAELAQALREAGLSEPTPQQVSEAVVAIRRRK
ncbi:MAG TPA: UDP-N-acetylenolpyruvoylglucosamine reductase, partial [Massilia sp.]|nr:UDP-N-acetylenolpyruvoylglucosamine reductase [Massilia sp.]